MIVLELKAYPNKQQQVAILEAIRTAQFVQNKCLRHWMDNKEVGKKEIFQYNTSLRADFPFVKDLNSHASPSIRRACMVSD